MIIKIKQLLNDLGYPNSALQSWYPENIHSFYLTFGWIENVDRYIKTFETIKRYFPLAKIRNNIHNIEVIIKDG